MKHGPYNDKRMHRRAALAVLSAVLFVCGQLALQDHQYDHLHEPGAELTCQLCVAGDHNPPVANAARPAPRVERDTATRAMHLPTRAHHPLLTAHPPRAPPVIS